MLLGEADAWQLFPGSALHNLVPNWEAGLAISQAFHLCNVFDGTPTLRFHGYQYFKLFSRQVVLFKMYLQSLLCSFFFLLKVAQHGWDPIVSHSFLNKQTNCLNFHFHFYFLQFLRFFWDCVILLTFPEDLSFNRNNIKLFPFFSSPPAPFLEYAIVTTTLT